MRKTIKLLCLVPLLLAAPAHSDDLDGGMFSYFFFEDDEETLYPSTEVADAYVDLRSGPGRGFPIEQSVERGGVLDVIKRRTDWFLVRTERGYEGWVHRTQLIATLNSRGERISIAEYGMEAFSKRTWEFGAMVGRFEGANGLGVHADYFITPNIAAELSYLQALGDVSDNRLMGAGLQHYFKPEWRVSPYVGVGLGQLQVEPSASLVESDDRKDSTRYAQGGLAVHVMERFMFRLDYRHHLILTNRDNNEEIDEWKAGFAVFY